MADWLIKALLVQDLETPVFVEKEFNVRCFIRGHHIYQTQWNAEIGARLTTTSETRPGAFVEYKYAIDVINNGKTFWHVLKFLTKLAFFFLKNGGTLHITVTGPRKYSVYLKQGELELPADFCFTSLNENCFFKWKKRHWKRRRSMGSNRKKDIKKKKRKRKRNWNRKNRS